MEYKIKKEVFRKEDIHFMRIFFENGDYLPVSGRELQDFSVKLYDRLVLENNSYTRHCCPVVESGFIKFKPTKKVKGFYTDAYLNNYREYSKDRSLYIKNRLISENDVKYVQIFDKNDWRHTLLGNITAQVDDNCVTLLFKQKNNNQSCNGEYHTISLPEVKKTMIKSLYLDFENCEGFDVYNDEIVDLQLKFKEMLCVDSSDYNREIESGYIKLKFDEKYNEYRDNSFFDDLSKGKKGNKEIEMRLCGRKGIDLHDICHLYIDYEYAGFGEMRKECIEIEDIRSDEEFAEIEKYEGEEIVNYLPYYLGGYCEKTGDGYLLITFGETAIANTNCQKLLKEYSIFKLKKQRKFRK